MNFSAVIIGLCALVALTHGRHLGDAAWNATLRLMHQEITAILSQIDSTSGMIPDLPCASQNMMELEQAKQGNLTAAKLSLFRCHIMDVSELTKDLPGLKKISQYSLDVERELGSQAADQDCTLPTFEEESDTYIYIKCLLELLVELITKAKF